MHYSALSAHPDFALILIALGALCVTVEFNAPGLILPGVIGATLTVLGFASMASQPLDWRGAALIILALGLIVRESRARVHGAWGAIATCCLWLGLTMLVNGSQRIDGLTAAAVSAVFAPGMSFLLSVAERARRNKTVILKTAVHGQIQEIQAQL